MPVAKEMAQWVERLHSINLSSLPRNSSIWEVEAEESGVQGHSLLCREFEASLSYTRPSLDKAKPNIQKN